MDQWYIIRLFKQSKLLFVLFCGFLSFQLFFTTKRVHNYPFYIYDMYSRPVDIHNTHSLYEIIVNDQPLEYTGLTIWKEGVIINTLRLFEFKKDNNGDDPWAPALKDRDSRINNAQFSARANHYLLNNQDDFNRFPEWLATYISNSTRQKVHRLSINKVTYVYAEPVSKRNILNWNE